MALIGAGAGNGVAPVQDVDQADASGPVAGPDRHGDVLRRCQTSYSWRENNE